MVRKKDLVDEINGYLSALENKGFPFQKAILFGSMVKGNIHHYSDIDLAVWSEKFEGNYFELMEKLAPLKRKFSNIELHPFHTDDEADNNFFIQEIENTGIVILPKKPLLPEDLDYVKANRP